MGEGGGFGADPISGEASVAEGVVDEAGAAGQVADGRTLRWQQHNADRRALLVDASLKAIRAHGAGVSMDQIAAQAGTSKTVIYRHFTDRAGLYRAVADKVGRRIERSLREAIASVERPTRPGLAAVVEAYLALMEGDAEVYRFVVRPPALGGEVAEREVFSITDRAAGVLLAWLATEMGERRARVWSVAIAGAVHSCADRWLAEPVRWPRTELVHELVEFAWVGLGPPGQAGQSLALGEQGLAERRGVSGRSVTKR
ncbi:MAG: TetR/AcrR family transcriptional regulator [Propionibacteriaceae bacterium]|nr:TetR/AcrR family transcriptional regulator [Propionibacteriaceae bacterium]